MKVGGMKLALWGQLGSRRAGEKEAYLVMYVYDLVRVDRPSCLIADVIDDEM